MNKRLWKKVYFCVVFPFLVSGIVTIGFYYFIPDIFPVPVNLLISGGCGYLIGSLVGSKFKWKKEKEK